MRYSSYCSKSSAPFISIVCFIVLCLVIFAFNHGPSSGSTGIITVGGAITAGQGPSSQQSGAGSKSSENSSNSPATIKQPTAANSSPSLNAPRQARAQTDTKITVDNSGFHADAVYVASGATVKWTNTGNEPHQIAPSLNPYNPDQPLAAMHSEVLQPGQSYSFVITYDMTDTGSAGYYDAKVPAHKGDIAVAKP